VRGVRALFAILLITLAVDGIEAQSAMSTRLAILLAEDRRAPTARDLAIIRAGVRSRDPQTARIAVRALGRLERPALLPDVVPMLKNRFPEIRAEAANAIGQAVQGLKRDAPPRTPAARTTSAQADPQVRVADGVLAALIARLDVEEEPSVRAAICETLGRVPVSPDQVRRAEATIVGTLSGDRSIAERLGAAKGLEALVRLHPSEPIRAEETVAALRSLAGPPGQKNGEAARDERVRRLALEALITAKATDDELVDRAASDADAQVRRLAMRAAAVSGGAAGALNRGLADPAPMVRLEALRGVGSQGGEQACAASVTAAGDSDPHVALLALDQLGACGDSSDATSLLGRAVNDLSQAGSARGWHRSAHALVALATASPDRAGAALGQFTGSTIWQLRLYAARAATTLNNRRALEQLAADVDDNVVEAAIDGLAKVAGHASDEVYVTALGRRGYQAIRAAARALDATPEPDSAVGALKEALQRLDEEGRDNSRDARAALTETLTALGAPVPIPKTPRAGGASGTPAATVEELRRLASPRARVTIRGVGSLELALFTSEAPATVLRFARLAESGYYNGLTFHRIVPNVVIQGGSPGSNEYIGDATFMRDELGLWPHVRGAVGISTRGRDTGDAQIFIDLVDNPRFDHDYTVFAQVLNGIDVIDRILEGDVIEGIEIVPGP